MFCIVLLFCEIELEYRAFYLYRTTTPSPPRTHTHSNKHRRKWNSTMCLTPFVCHCLLSLALRRSALAIGIFDSIVISNLWLFNLEYCCSIPWAIVCAARFVAIANDDCYCGIDHSFQSRTHTQTHHVHYIRKIWSNIFKWVLFTAYYLLLPYQVQDSHD